MVAGVWMQRCPDPAQVSQADVNEVGALARVLKAFESNRARLRELDELQTNSPAALSRKLLQSLPEAALPALPQPRI